MSSHGESIGAGRLNTMEHRPASALTGTSKLATAATLPLGEKTYPCEQVSVDEFF